MLQVQTDLPAPERPKAAPIGADLIDPVSGVVVRSGCVTAIAAALPADAVAIADRLGRYTREGDETLLGGVPLKDFDPAALRKRILVADNDARLFSGPLRDDLDPCRTGRTAAALDAASANDVIEELPDGLDSEVAERGRSFSGGQQQRLRLARALIADPEILVLVEPTSAVDAHTEARIADRLRRARQGRTTVVCSTSPLVLDRADHVIYVEDGLAVAQGTHRELLDGSLAYARTVLRE
jgi:ABC-type multidrug transport system fused ATPase/permease subunit